MVTAPELENRPPADEKHQRRQRQNDAVALPRLSPLAQLETEIPAGEDCAAGQNGDDAAQLLTGPAPAPGLAVFLDNRVLPLKFVGQLVAATSCVFQFGFELGNTLGALPESMGHHVAEAYAPRGAHQQR